MKTIILFIIAIFTILRAYLKVTFSWLAIIILASLLLFIWYRLSYKFLIFFIFLFIILLLFPNINVDLNFIRLNINLNHIRPHIRSYINLFLLNDKSNDLYQSSIILGITYLITISGLHFHFIYNGLIRILNYIFDEYISNLILFSFLFFYLVLLGFSISALRAFLMLFLSFLNIKFFHKKLSSLDICFIVLIVITLLMPKEIFNYGYIYSFTLTFAIIIMSQNTKFNAWKLSLLSFLISIPISSFMNGYINIFTPLYSMLLTIPFFLSMIVSFVVILLPFLQNLLNYYFLGLNKICFFLTKTSIFINIKFDKLLIIVYYAILLSIILNLELKIIKEFKNRLFSVITILSILSIKPYFENPYQVTFLNVYQGDCAVFTSRYSRIAYLVDSGGNKNINIAYKIIYPFLKQRGITKIKAIVKTHNDYDHIGALSQLKKLITIEQEIERVNKICFFKYCFENINKQIYENDNDNSIVLYGSYSNINLLLTGDISYTVEKNIMETYPYLDVDVLKVSHHGSKYSSSYEFLNLYRPKVSIISYGYNYYGHPHNEVINRLSIINSKIYTTFDEGNITISRKSNHMIITFSKRKKVHFIAL